DVRQSAPTRLVALFRSNRLVEPAQLRHGRGRLKAFGAHVAWLGLEDDIAIGTDHTLQVVRLHEKPPVGKNGIALRHVERGDGSRAKRQREIARQCSFLEAEALHELGDVTRSERIHDPNRYEIARAYEGLA